MYSTNVYKFKPRQVVVLYSGNSTRRYQIVYAKNLTLNKGVDNIIQFQFLNQEQKFIDISSFDITFRLINYTGKEILFRKALTATLPLTGIAELVTNSSDLEMIDIQQCFYSLEINDGTYDLPVFVNSEASARGVIQIVDSILPSFVPAMDIEIPSHAIPESNTVTYTSSVMSTNNNSLLTIQPFLDGYSGTVQVQGSTLPDSGWYNIGNTYAYLDATETVGYAIDGFHPYIRVQFVSTQGNVTGLLAR